MRSVTHVANDEQRSKIMLEVGAFVELGGELDFTVRGHPNLLAKFTKHGVARILIFRTAAARQAPSGRVTQPDEDRLTLWGKRQRVRSERPRTPNEPAELEQAVGSGDDQPQEGVEHCGGTPTLAARGRPWGTSSAKTNMRSSSNRCLRSSPRWRAGFR